MTETANDRLVLGLDLGANSVGWALLTEGSNGATGLLAAGARVFEAGVEGKIESGKDESRNVARRAARQQRRQTDRRARRHTHLAALLQRVGLLSAGDVRNPAARHEYFTVLDKNIRGQHMAQAKEFPHVFPYWLRARALDERLELHELGRALYHLSQRRGFLSNRKAVGKEKEDEKSKVKKAISDLAQQIQDTGARTLGEYFAGLDPVNPLQRRIRERWTSRQMYTDEFEKIWNAQLRYHAHVLTPETRAEIHHAIFRQRPLKLQRHLIGTCPFEVDRKRAPMALLISQRFRLLQKLNDLLVVYSDSDFHERPLAAEERTHLLEKLQNQEELKFTQARKHIPKGCQFNLERGGEKRLVGNRTNAKLARIFGDRWQNFTSEERAKIVDEVRSYEKDAALARRGMNHYGLDAETARKFGELDLEPGYCSLSRQALVKILPLLEEGIRYSTAVKQIYGGDPCHAPVGLLMCVPDAIRQKLIQQPRNPVVNRVLTELHKVINALIQKYGKPDTIRIELARDVKKPRKVREKIWKRNRENEAGRSSAAQQIFAEIGEEHPRRDLVERYLLWEECGGVCPYTGKGISLKSLLSDQSEFDVEHIIPFSRRLDNSFMNKTLCYHEYNRSMKRNRTPYECASSNPDDYNAMIERVKRFKGEGRDGKLRRFLMKDLEAFDDFSSRQLNDTRYASTLARDYLALLYGAKWREHIQVSAGNITAYLRDMWSLNKILGDGGSKSRDDHRHHAVDAITIALTTSKTVKDLSQTAEREEIDKRRRPGTLPMPWNTFLEDVQGRIDGIAVSHRVSRKVNGRLHEETFYSPQPPAENGKPCVHVRKRVDALSTKEIENIADPVVQRHVKDRLTGMGISDPKKAFALPENHPYMEIDGKRVPIHKVRIRKTMSTFPVGKEHRTRHVSTDTNHHMEVLEITKKGLPRWEDDIVSQYKAVQRLRKNEPVIQHDHGKGKEFVFSLAVGETIELESESGAVSLFTVRSISKDLVEYCGINDARKIAEIIAAGDWGKRRLNFFRTNRCRKVVITPLGEVRRAND